MTNIAKRALLQDGLAAVAEWEAEHGPLSDEELDVARKRVFGTITIQSRIKLSSR